MTTAVQQLMKDLYGQSPNGYGNDIALLHLAEEIDAIPTGGNPGGTTGQVQYNNAGAFGAIATGTTGQVLTSNGAGVPPSMQAAGSGSAPPGTSALIASAIGVDLNTAGDTAMTLSAFATGKFFVVDYVLATNPSISLTTAVANVWSGAAGSGQSYSGFTDLADLVNPRDWNSIANVNNPNTTLATQNGTMQNTAPIVNVGTPQGSAATADFYVYGRVFT